MPQISLYIDGPTLRKIEELAGRQNVSISRWVAEQVRSKIEPCYPPEFEQLFGSVQDATFQRPVGENPHDRPSFPPMSL